MKTLKLTLILNLCCLLILPLNLKASETSTYEFKWLDPDKEVYVLQNRKYRKNSKLHLSFNGGITTSGPFHDGKVVQGRLGYFFMEDWGFEFLYSKGMTQKNETYDSLISKQTVPLVREIQNYYGVMVLYSPFYTKMNAFNKILYTDWIFGVGVAKINEDNNTTAFNTDDETDTTITKEQHNGLLWQIAMRFYVSKNWALRLSFNGIHYKANQAVQTNPGETNYSNYDLAFGVVFSI